MAAPRREGLRPRDTQRATPLASPGRFTQERNILIALDHPNIVKLFDAGREGPFLWFAMELMLGGTLAEHIHPPSSQHPPEYDIPAAMAIALQLCNALQHAHERGVLHRDLKPENVLVDAEDVTHVKLADFGIARIMQADSRLTSAGSAVGTPEYMAPEQIQGQDGDARSDVYALGCLIYALLAGRPPFIGSVNEVGYAHIHKMPDLVNRYQPAVPKELAMVLHGAFYPDPARRYQAMRDFAVALAPWTQEEPGATMIAEVQS